MNIWVQNSHTNPYFHQRHGTNLCFIVRVLHSFVKEARVRQAIFPENWRPSAWNISQANQMCDKDWVPHPASWLNSSYFHPDVLETSTENLMKLVQCTEEGATIFWCPAGGEITSNFSTVGLVHTFQQTPEQDLFSPFMPPVLNHSWTLSSSLS